MNTTATQLRRLLGEHKKLIFLLRVFFVVLAIGWLIYALFAHSLIEATYNGASVGFLNKIIADRGVLPLEHYFERADHLFFLLNSYVIIVFVLIAIIFIDRNTKFGSRVSFFVISVVLLCTMLFVKPVLFGDAPGYFLVTESLFNHLTPDLQERDLESIKALEEKFGFPILYRDVQRVYYFDANDGNRYSCHFWAYPLLNLPVKAALRVLHLNETKVFQITNAIFLVLALFVITYIAALTELQRRLFSFLVLLCPAFWFIYWPHTEVFSYSFVVISLACMSRQNWRAAVLFAAIAATQNPPIIFMVMFHWLLGIIHSKKRGKDLIYLSLLAIPAGGAYIFSLLKYGKLSLYVAKSTGTHFMSVYKAFELFFDLNIGMFPYIPMALLMFFGVIIRDAVFKRKLTVGLQLFILLFIMMYACTASSLWNHGTTGPSRYVIWMLPVVFYVIINEVGQIKSKRSIYIMFLWIAIAIQALIIFRGGGFTSVLNHTSHTPVAKFVLNHFPALYNPTPEIFAVRTTRHIVNVNKTESLGFIIGEHATPVVYRHNGKCRKALVKGKDGEALKDLCGYIPQSKKAFFENDENKEKTIYINY